MNKVNPTDDKDMLQHIQELVAEIGEDQVSGSGTNDNILVSCKTAFYVRCTTPYIEILSLCKVYWTYFSACVSVRLLVVISQEHT